MAVISRLPRRPDGALSRRKGEGAICLQQINLLKVTSSGMSNAAAKSCAYQRRRPELTPCYQIIAGHLNTFTSEREAEQRPLPEYVLEEFEAHLKCGILAHCFIWLKCTTCSAEKLVAFSCKKRGFCPSCCAKRMAEAATHLTQNVLPLVPYRQFVVSFPIPLRYWLHTNKRFASEVFGLVAREIHRYYLHKAHAAGITNATPGSIAFIRRWGSALNLNPHLHILCIDGVYTRYGEAARLGPLSNERLEILANGDVKLALKTPWANGTTHLVFTPSEFIEKLMAIIPLPRSHLVRWAWGVCSKFSIPKKHYNQARDQKRIPVLK